MAMDIRVTVETKMEGYTERGQKIYEVIEQLRTSRANEMNGKGKVLPRTGHEGPEGEQMYSSILPLTSELDVGGWSTSRPGRFTPGKDPVPIV